jgi:hypothetical protein
MVLLLKEKRAKTVSERIFHAGGNPCLSEGLTRVQVNEELLADQALSFE